MSVLDLIGNRRLRKIDILDELTLLRTLDTIVNIHNIRNAVFTQNFCRNGSFETGTTEDWESLAGDHAISSAQHYDGLYSLTKSPCNTGVWQNIIPCYGDEVLISFQVRTDIAQNFTLLIEYSDLDSETTTGAVAINTWTFFAFAPTKHKIIQNITFYGTNATAGKSFWLDRVQVIKNNLTRLGAALPAGTNNIGDVDVLTLPNVAQATRTSLKVQPEREDLISFGGNYTPNAVAVEVVAPSGSLKPKIYDVSFECAVDGLHYLMFAPNTTLTTRRLCSIITKGKYGKTLVMPRVGNAGDGIYAYSAVNETNWQIDLGYVLE